jgi:hypothetical protein
LYRREKTWATGPISEKSFKGIRGNKPARQENLGREWHRHQGAENLTSLAGKLLEMFLETEANQISESPHDHVTQMVS